MLTYVYKNEDSGETVEIFHSMSELDKPSESLLKLITYEYNGEIKKMKTVLFAPSLHGFTSGTSTSKNSNT